MRALFWVVIAAACGDKHPPPAGPTNTAGSQAKPAPASTASACDTLVVYVEQAGTWIGAPPDVVCDGPSQSGAPDAGWIEGELRKLKARLSAAGCEPGVELAADGVSYQEMVLVMDLAVRVGLIDVGLSDPGSLAMTLPPPLGGLPAGQCDGKLDTTHEAKPASKPSGPPASRDALQQAPVVIVTTSELRLGDKTLVDVATVAKGTGSIPELVKALQDPPKKDMVILQADASTPARAINRIVLSAKRAGIDNVLFAVKNK